MKDPAGEAKRWLEQARYDLDLARYNAAGGFHAAACFQAQQAAEKALKAFLYGRGERVVFGHSVAELCDRCQSYQAEFGALKAKMGRLDRFYIPTRYPNGLPGGIPAEMYDQSDAKEAITWASEAIEAVERYLREES